MILMGLVVVLAWGAPALGDDSSGKSKKDKALEEVAPSIGKGEAAAGVLDQLSQAIGKIVSSVMPAAPGAEEMGEAAGETATTGAKVVKDYRTRGDAVISDDGDVMIYNEETGKYEKF
ncbi:MAG: hypothetical protein MI747_21395 [Desulfobacterales bacterium]|nr:hypothetical protein [Desulfobacterales bacterium]